jgi:uncharacterized membrane protein
MIWMILGLVLWSAAHLLKRLAPAMRARMGGAGRGVVTIGVLAGVVLMVIGYRVWDDSALLWNRSAALTGINNLLMLVSVYLFAASGMKTKVAQVLRHPQLMAVILWAVAHLLTNGDVASLVLFGVLALWALAEMAVINASGPWQRPEAPVKAGKEIGAAVGAVLVTVALGYLHVRFGLMPWGG